MAFRFPRGMSGARRETALAGLELSHPGITRFRRQRLWLLRAALVLRVILNALSAFGLSLISGEANPLGSVLGFGVVCLLYWAMASGGWRTSLLLLAWSIPDLLEALRALPLFAQYPPWFQLTLILELLGSLYFLALGAWLCILPKHRRYAQALRESSDARR